ncbi:MAG: acyltransferase family protein [Pseudomonadota bacterium]
MTTGESETYYADLDIARAILMALLVVLHSVNVFAPDSPAPIHTATPHHMYALVSIAIQLFQLPAFFMVSGFFCWLSLSRHGARRFMVSRAQRILVPLAVTALTLNLVELWLRARVAGETRGLIEFVVSVFTHGAESQGSWTYHLWFLVVLFVYFAVSALIVSVVGERQIRAFFRQNRQANPATWPGFVVVIFGVLASYLPAALGQVLPGLVYADAFPGVPVYALIDYAPFFFFGVLLALAPEAIERLRTPTLGKATAFLVAIILIPIIIVFFPVGSSLEIGLWALGAWMTTLTLFSLVLALVRNTPIDAQSIAAPAYTIYLVHHVLVLAVGMGVLGLAWPSWLQCLSLVVIVYGVSAAFHYLLVRRVRVLRFALNGT